MKRPSILKTSETRREAPPRPCLDERVAEKAGVSEESQEALKRALFKAAEQKLMSFLENGSRNLPDPTPEKRTAGSAERLKRFFENEVFAKNLFPALIYLYDRYRDDPLKSREFSKLEAIIKDEQLTAFWSDVAKDADKHPHRLVDQPKEEPDLIHPFHLVAGLWYLEDTVNRGQLIQYYQTARCKLSRNDYPAALANFTTAIRRFIPRTQQYRDLRTALIKERDFLQTITNWTKNRKEAEASFGRIRQTMDRIIELSWVAMDAGMKHGDFGCYINAQGIDQGELETLHHENRIQKQITTSDEFLTCLSEEAQEVIQRIIQRNAKFLDIYIYPSYLSAARTSLGIALAYKHLAEVLVNTMSSSMRRALSTVSCDFSGENMLSTGESSLTVSIIACQNSANFYFVQALNYAYAPIYLADGGNYDSIAYNGRRFLTSLVTFEDTQHCTFKHFSAHFHREVLKEWGALTDKCSVITRRMSLPKPVPCKEDLDNIVERHKAPPRDAIAMLTCC